MKVFLFLLGAALPTYSLAEDAAVSALTYGDDWPFPVEEGIVRCEPSSTAVLLQTEEGIFALNGSALGQVDSQGWLDTRDFQERDESGMFLNGVDTIRALIKLGLEDC